MVLSMFPVVVRDRVRVLTINNPKRKNAIPPDGWPQLAAAFDDFAASDQRVLVVTGAGEDFCSGADLGEGGLGTSIAERYESMAVVGRAATALRRLPKPVVAAVDGVAVGAGMNLALGCDIVLATPRARFSEIFVKRGLTVDFGGSWLLPRIVGLARAKELALTGRIVSGEEALEIGLVSKLVAPAGLAKAAIDLAGQLAEGAPLAQRFIKTALDRSLDMSFEEALAYEEQAQAVCLSSEDVVEGVQAFMEKRPPQFRGR